MAFNNVILLTFLLITSNETLQYFFFKSFSTNDSLSQMLAYLKMTFKAIFIVNIELK
jgi:hypothetical protein